MDLASGGGGIAEDAFLLQNKQAKIRKMGENTGDDVLAYCPRAYKFRAIEHKSLISLAGGAVYDTI